MIGGPTRDRERFPGVQADIGEDPARYLDVERVSDLRLARARIRGIDFLNVVRAWKAVERNLAANGHVSEHHREQVLGWLDEREAELAELGERDARLPDEIERRTAADEPAPSDDGPAVIHEGCGSVAEARHGPGHWCPDCETVTRAVVAADGGDGV